ncbi:MAG: EAL domain-containing protein [Rubrivivax sp.]
MTLRSRAADWLAKVFGPEPDEAALEDAAERLAARPRSMPAEVAPVRRVRSAVDEQVAELEALRRQAHTDAVTALPNRRHFMGRLSAALSEPGNPAAGLLILRVMHLGSLNMRIGHDATDSLLAALAEVLGTYPQRVTGAFTGRLNGSDFALFLPVAGVADETAQTLMRALRASAAAASSGLEFVIGGADSLIAPGAGGALAAADEALAEAEAAGPYTIEIRSAAGDGAPPMGERVWRQRIELALSEGRISLGEFPVQDQHGALIHLDCPLRVQLAADGPFQVASRWLAMASRGRLLPLVDLAALDLALTAIANDGRARCVHMSAVSLGGAGFVGEVQRRLDSAGEAAARLWIDIGEGPSLERTLPRLREAAVSWRRHAVHLGVEHAGASMNSLPRLAGLGLDHIKVGARFVRGVATDSAVRNFVAALATLAHSLGWKIIAEGIDEPADLQALWALGFDGATGPALVLATAPG